MKKNIIVCGVMIFFAFFYSCKSHTAAEDNSIPKDSANIASGEVLFSKNCEGCHNFRQDGIGPQLSAVTTRLSTEWFVNFIKDPQKVISSGDEHAQLLYAKYKVAMPSFSLLKDEEIKQLIAFLNTHTDTTKVVKGDDNNIKDPISAKIQKSSLVAGLQFIAQVPASSDSGKKPLARITQMIVQPTTHKLFILDLRGKLYQLQQGKPALYMDMQKLRPNFINEPGLATGFGSVAFHPDFMKNGLFYTTHTEKPGSAKADFAYNDSIKVTLQWVLTEWKVDNVNASSFSGKGRELLRINMVTGIHGMQEIAFNPLAKPGEEDYGLLYAGIGDGGCTEEGCGFLAHNKKNLWGTIIRIDPAGNNSANGNYGIPATNPFANIKEDAGEIYALGFRNPHRITWLQNGSMLVSNVGQSNIESINLIKAGNDYGWPIREGNFVIHTYEDINKVYPLNANDSVNHITYPVIEFDHDEGKAVSGGYEYTGTSVPSLKGKFLFGDIPSGRLFYADVNDIKQESFAAIKEWNVSLNNSIRPLKEICGNDRVDLHFGRDARGEIYIITKADGKIYKIMNATENK